MWSVDVSVDYLKSHVRPHSIGRCAEFTRRAIEAGGITLQRHLLAEDYGTSLTMAGFTRQPDSLTEYEAGDVVIISGFAGNEAGHMAMYSGSAWISDFVQRTLYPGPAYRRERPPYVVYRYVVGAGVEAITTPLTNVVPADD